MKFFIYTIIVLFLSISALVSAQTYTSTDNRINLVELYTSEGCSSCPPADKWLSKLKRDSRLWSEFIPLAFHVDYWDYIGWKDPFANPQFSKRQRQHAQQKNISSVYTPGMLISGKELISWRRQSKLILPPNIATGKLTVDLNDSVLSASYQPVTKPQADLILNIAILGFDLETHIKAGENAGRTLTHDFVVVGFRQITMQQSESGLYTISSESLPKPSTYSSKTAIATWINNSNNLTPIQATGGWVN